jgi:hypothetical protein
MRYILSNTSHMMEEVGGLSVVLIVFVSLFVHLKTPFYHFLLTNKRYKPSLNTFRCWV